MKLKKNIKLNPNRPLGITVMGLYFLAYGVLFIIFRASLLYGKGDPTGVLEALEISYFNFFIRYFLPPVLMIFAAYGMWHKKYWGWWLSVLMMASIAMAFLIIFFKLPFHDFLIYVVSQRNGLLINIVVLVYLFLPTIFKKFHGGKVNLVIVALTVFIVSTIIGDYFAGVRIDSMPKY